MAQPKQENAKYPLPKNYAKTHDQVQECQLWMSCWKEHVYTNMKVCHPEFKIEIGAYLFDQLFFWQCSL